MSEKAIRSKRQRLTQRERRKDKSNKLSDDVIVL